MNMKKLLTGAALLLTLAVSGAPARAQAGPETVVANLYRAATAKSVAEMSKTQLRKYFGEGLADDIWKAARGEEGLGFDLLYHAQDTRIKNFRIGKYERGWTVLGLGDGQFYQLRRATKNQLQGDERDRRRGLADRRHKLHGRLDPDADFAPALSLTVGPLLSAACLAADSTLLGVRLFFNYAGLSFCYR